jgi:hypothetical protein
MQNIQMIYLITENVWACYNRECKATLHITANNSATDDVNQKQTLALIIPPMQRYCAQI